MSRDFLAETIADYSAGIISLATVQSRLNFDMSQRDNAPHIEDYWKCRAIRWISSLPPNAKKKYFEITKNGVAYRLERIREYADGMQGLLRIEPRQYTATTPKIKVRYPMDAAKAKKPCGIPEYLNEAGVPSVCTLCERSCSQCQTKKN